MNTPFPQSVLYGCCGTHRMQQQPFWSSAPTGSQHLRSGLSGWTEAATFGSHQFIDVVGIMRLTVSTGFLSGEQEGRMDLSHPVHADNCLLDPEGNTCWREPPAYMYRDYR